MKIDGKQRKHAPDFENSTSSSSSLCTLNSPFVWLAMMLKSEICYVCCSFSWCNLRVSHLRMYRSTFSFFLLIPHAVIIPSDQMLAVWEVMSFLLFNLEVNRNSIILIFITRSRLSPLLMMVIIFPMVDPFIHSLISSSFQLISFDIIHADTVHNEER